MPRAVWWVAEALPPRGGEGRERGDGRPRRSGDAGESGAGYGAFGWRWRRLDGGGGWGVSAEIGWDVGAIGAGGAGGGGGSWAGTGRAGKAPLHAAQVLLRRETCGNPSQTNPGPVGAFIRAIPRAG